MEQLKSEQIRVQAEERRKTLSEETRQHQAVRAAGGGRGAGVRHGPEAQSGAVLGPLRPRGGLAHAAGPRNSSELSVTGARVSACARAVTQLAARAARQTPAPSLQSSGGPGRGVPAHRLLPRSMLTPPPPSPRGPSTRTSWPGSATRTS